MMRGLNFAFVALLALAGLQPALASGKCAMQDSFPPPSNSSIAWQVIDLDLPPEQRWAKIVTPLKDNITALIDTVTDVLPSWLLQPIIDRCDSRANSTFLNRFPAPYSSEIEGIAAATGLDVCLIILYNIFYEVTGLCTSIVAEDADGNILHARNLDFGIGPSWDKIHEQWTMTEKLRPLLVNLEFQRGGEVLYRTTQYAGYVGLLTGVRPGGFSITVDSRFDSNFDKFLVEWIFDRMNGSWLGFTTRSVMEQETSYDAAVARLSSTLYIGPSYIIVGGTESGQGAVITNGPNLTASIDVWTIAKGLPSSAPFFVLETNYDHWKQPPFFDDRRSPAEDCLTNYVTSANVSESSLFNVLHALPNRNRLTTYTSVMSAAKGTLDSWLVYCLESDCPLV